jgi:hypothetical protein
MLTSAEQRWWDEHLRDFSERCLGEPSAGHALHFAVGPLGCRAMGQMGAASQSIPRLVKGLLACGMLDEPMLHPALASGHDSRYGSDQ